MLVPVDGFPEVPLEVVEASGRTDVASERWRHRNESIIVLEIRALTRGIEILASTQQLFFGVDLYSQTCQSLRRSPERALADEENAGHWIGKDSDGSVVNRWTSTDKEKCKMLEKVSLGTSQGNCESWRGSDPRELVLPRKSVSEPWDRGKAQKANRTVPQLGGQGKTGARRGRRGRCGNRAVQKHELQPRTTCDRRRDPIGRTSALPTPVREAGRKARSVRENSEGLEKAGSDTFKTIVANYDPVSNLLGEEKKLETSDDFPEADEDCDVPPIWGTLADDVRGLDETNAWSGKQLVSALPPSSKRRAEQNTKTEKLQSWPPAVPPKRSSSIDTKTSPKSFTGTGTEIFRSHRLRSRGAYLWETPNRGRLTTLSDGGRRLGVRAAFWNLRYGERYDVTHRVTLRRLLRDIANGGVLGWNVSHNCSRPFCSSTQKIQCHYVTLRSDLS